MPPASANCIKKKIMGGVTATLTNDCTAGETAEGTCGVNLNDNGNIKKFRGCKKTEAQQLASILNTQPGVTATWCCASC
jgi:hypothetical protein